MLGTKVLGNTVFSSVLGGSSLLAPSKNGRTKKKGQAALLLTSLVDSFAILVIFLMMNSTTSYNVKLDPSIKLPAAIAGHPIEKAVTLTIKGGRYFLEKQELGASDLAMALNKIVNTEVAEDATTTLKNQYKSLIVVADKEMNFSDLNPLIKLASSAGITEFKFAVLPKNGSASN